MQYQFRRDVTVEGVPHKADEIIDEAGIPVGSLESLLATWIEPYVPPSEPEVVDSDGQKEEQTPATHHKRKGK
jgi:hypothetical protein